MKVDGYEVTRKLMLEQLQAVIDGYPLWPGDTISHRSAKACMLAGWIVRQKDGNWIPTRLGLVAIEEGLA